MKSLIEFQPGYFYALGRHGWATVYEKCGPAEYRLGSEYKTNTMLGIWDLHIGEQLCGLFFHSALPTINRGGFIVSCLPTKAGKATSSRVILRTDEVIAIDFPGCGSMAITTKVSDLMYSLLTEQ